MECTLGKKGVILRHIHGKGNGAATGIGYQVYYHCRAVLNGTHSVHDAVHLITPGHRANSHRRRDGLTHHRGGTKSIMVIATYLANRLLHPLQEKLRQEGSQKNQAQWEAWNERRMEADKRGEPFDEPPPGKGADVDALGVQLLDGPETFGEVTRQAVDRRDHDDVAGIELFPERRPPGAAYGPARGHVGEDAVVPEPGVGEDAALGGQAALALRL